MAVVHPDNTLELMAKHSQKTTYVFQRLLGIALIHTRRKKGEYRAHDAGSMKQVEHTHAGTTRTRTDWKWAQTNGPIYRPGLRMSLNTRRWINPEPVMRRVEDKAAALRWRRQLGAYKRGWLVRAKMGLFAAIIERYGLSSWRTRRELTSGFSCGDLHTAIVSEDFTDATCAKILACGDLYLAQVLSTPHYVGMFNRAYANRIEGIRYLAGCWREEPVEPRQEPIHQAA
jgi:hypothetical protein